MKTKSQICKLPTKEQIDEMIKEVLSQLPWTDELDRFEEYLSDPGLLRDLQKIVKKYIKPVQLTKAIKNDK